MNWKWDVEDYCFKGIKRVTKPTLAYKLWMSITTVWDYAHIYFILVKHKDELSSLKTTYGYIKDEWDYIWGDYMNSEEYISER